MNAHDLSPWIDQIKEEKNGVLYIPGTQDKGAKQRWWAITPPTRAWLLNLKNKQE